MATSACTSSVTAYSLSSQSCQICYEEYSEEEKKAPRVLLCGHTFCTGQQHVVMSLVLTDQRF